MKGGTCDKPTHSLVLYFINGFYICNKTEKKKRPKQHKREKENNQLVSTRIYLHGRRSHS